MEEAFDYGPPTIKAMPNGQRFTTSTVDSSTISDDGAPLEVITRDPDKRTLDEVIPNSQGCITEDENRARYAKAMELDLPSISVLKAANAGQRLILCGGGSSITRTLPRIREAIAAGAKVMAVNKTHDWLIAQGIVPDYAVLMDPRPHVADYVTPHEDVKYLLGASLDETAYPKFTGFDAYLWFPVALDADIPYVRDLIKERYPFKSAAFVPGPSTVGLRALYIAMDFLAFVDIEGHGFDSCYDCETNALWPYPKTVSFEEVRIEFTSLSRQDGSKFSCTTNPDMGRQVYELEKMIGLLLGSVRAGKRSFLPKLTFAGDGVIPWMAWKNGGHATPELMQAKYGNSKHYDYDKGAERREQFDISPIALPSILMPLQMAEIAI